MNTLNSNQFGLMYKSHRLHEGACYWTAGRVSHMNLVNDLAHLKSLCSLVVRAPDGMFKSGWGLRFFSFFFVLHSRHAEHLIFHNGLEVSSIFLSFFQDTLTVCWAFEPDNRPSFSNLLRTLERLPKIRQRLHRSPSQPCTVGRGTEALI